MKKSRLNFVSTFILLTLVIGCFTFVNQVNASTSTSFQDPSSSSGNWSNPTRAYDDDGSGYATSDSNGEQEKYGGYGFSLPTPISIISVTVRMDLNRPSAATADNIKLEVSVDGGTTFLASTRTLNVERDWHTYIIDVTSWTSWTADKINNDKIWVRVTHERDGWILEDMYLDWIPIEVTYDVLTTTTTSLSESTINLGASVTAQTSVIPQYSSLQPTGTVIFYAKPDGGSWSSFDSKTLTSGSATSKAYTPSSAGTWYFKTVYSGDSYFAGSSSGETDEALKVSSVVVHADSDWPMFHGDQSHSGYSTSTAPSTTPTFWIYDSLFAGMVSSPAVVDGVVYVGSQNNNVYALDAAAGTVEWSYYTQSGPKGIPRGVSSSPAVADDVVYVGSDYVYFYALDVKTGQQLWNYSIGSGASVCSPVVVSGIVYIGAISGELYALNAATGALNWSYATGGSVSSPAVVDGVVYVGSGDFNVYAFNALTGALKWTYPTGNYVYGSPTVADGVVYIGSTDNKVYALDAETGALKWSYTTGAPVYSCPAVVNGVVYIGSTDYKVYALDAAAGTVEWIYTTGGRVESSPAVANGVVYVGSDDWSIYGLDASTGTKLWSYSTGSPIRSSPAFANGVVYVTAYDGQVFAINAGTSITRHLTVNSEHGSPVSSSTGDIGQGTVVTVSVASTVAGSNGVRYVCTGWTGTGSVPASGTGTSVTFTIMDDSSITFNWKTQYYLTVSSAYGSPGGAAWYDSGAVTYATLTSTAVTGVPYIFTGWGGDTSGINYVSTYFSSDAITMDGPKTAIANWVQCNPTKWIQPMYSVGIRNSPAVANGILYVGVHYSLYALDASSAATLWYYNTGMTSGGVGGVRSSPIVVDGVVYCGSDGPSKNVYALNAVTGAEIWTYEIPGGVGFSSPAVADGLVYIGSPNCNLYALDAATGTLKWSYQAGAAITCSPTVANGIVYFGSEDHKVYALDAETGTLEWSYTTGHQIDYSSPTVVNGVVYIGSDDCKVYALDALTGALEWSYTTGGFVQSSPTVSNGVVYVGSGDANVYALNAATGAEIWSQVTGYVRTTPAVSDAVVYVSSINRNIYALDAATGTVLWSYATGDGVYSSPLVVNGVVYVGSNDGKVYAIKSGVWRPHLTVTSAYGSPTPASGSFCQGTVVTASVDSIVEGPAGVRYVCTGWTGTGNVPASGTGNSVVFTITKESSITWNWQTQYQLTFTVNPSGAGTTSPSTPPSDTSVWEDAGSLSISASANSGYAFSSWSSNTQSITFNHANSASTTATLNGPGMVTANFQVSDTTPPTGSVIINSGATYTKLTSVTLTLSANDPDDSVAQIRFSNDGSSWSSWESYATSKSWTLTSGDGAKTVYVQFKDSADNPSISYSDGITLDTTAPTMSFYNPPYYITSDSYVFQITVSDATSGVASVTLAIDSDPFQFATFNPASGFYECTVSGLSEGRHVVSYRSYDFAGNYFASAPSGGFSFVVDSVAPTGSVSINDGVAFTTTTSVALTLTSADTGGSGVNKVQYSNDGVTYSALEAASGTKAWVLTSGDGEKTVYFMVWDRAGNSAVFTDTITLDTTAPTGSITSPSEGAIKNTGNFAVTGLASDSTSGIQKVEISVDDGSYVAVTSGTTSWSYSASGLADGSHTFKIKVTDNAGWTYETSQISVKVDTVAPDTSASVTSGTSGSNGWYTSNVEVTIVPSDPDSSSGIASTSYSTDNSNWIAYTAPISITTEGTTTIYYYSLDNAGNTQATQQLAIKIDKTDPTLTKDLSGTAGSNGWYISHVEVTLTPDDDSSGSGVALTEYNLNAAGWTTYTAPFTISTEGENTLAHRVTDYAGRQYILTQQTIKIDDSDPTITINSPTSNLNFNVGTILVSGTSSDGAGVSKVEVKVDSGSYSLATGTTSWSFTTASLSPGTHTITAKVTDLGGTTTETSIEIAVGATSLTYSGATSGQYSDSITISARLINLATGNGISGKTITFTIGTQTTTAITNSIGEASTTLTLIQASGNSYTLYTSFAGDSSYQTSSDSDAFTISKEIVAITYTGSTFESTNGASSTTVTLSATLAQQADGSLGDLTLAKVTFALFKSGNLGSTPDIVISGVSVDSNGIASTTKNLATDVWTVKIYIDTGNGYWIQDSFDLKILTVTASTSGSVTGGGWIIDSGSATDKGNFGFSVQYNKHQSTKGNFVYVYRGLDGYDYIVKSNSWQGGGLSFTGTYSAVFSGKCVIQKVDPTTGEIVDSDGNAYYSVSIVDGNKKGADTFALSFSGTTYSRTIPVSLLGGGNIVVRSK